ncbi:diguanylate cyclase (GGDEF)-like protein [Oxalobacteraceae bacterium GrIS 2.11]
MRRLFKKYNLLLWLGLLLVIGLVINSALTLYLSRDMLAQQSLKKTLPLVGANLHAALQTDVAKALAMSPRIADDEFLHEWMVSEEQDSQSLIAHLRSAKATDNSLAHFLVSDANGKYVDSLGTVRTINLEDGRDPWYRKTRESNRPYDITIVPEPDSDNHSTLFLSRRLLNANHQFEGAVGLSVAINAFDFAAGHDDSDLAGSIYFVDQAGKIVLSNTGKAGNIHQQAGIKLLADALLKQQRTTNYSYDLDGTRIDLNARFIPELNWYLVVEDNPQNIIRQTWPLAYANALVGSITLIFALVLAWFSIARHQSRLRALASRDSMTGLMNRQSFTNSFQQEVLEMQRLKLPLSFILFDIDYLKKINESHGHATGDKIITDIARLSRRSVRGSDLLCRWSGEQFAVLLKRCELEQAYKVAEQLRLNVQNHSFAFDDQEASVTISLGVAEWTENESIDELFARVDEAVYLAKSEGRNRAEISYYLSI